ncbi:MAG: hypothetical protein ACE5HZ_08280 [Fidelibacterota bacterium]
MAPRFIPGRIEPAGCQPGEIEIRAVEPLSMGQPDTFCAAPDREGGIASQGSLGKKAGVDPQDEKPDKNQP